MNDELETYNPLSGGHTPIWVHLQVSYEIYLKYCLPYELLFTQEK